MRERPGYRAQRSRIHSGHIHRSNIQRGGAYGYIDESKPSLPAVIVPKVLRVLVLSAIIFIAAYIGVRAVNDIPGGTSFTAAEIAAFSAAAVDIHSFIPDLNVSPETYEALEAGRFNIAIPHVYELVQLIDEHPAAAIIAENNWRFPQALIELALRNHETIDFVSQFIELGRNINIDHRDVDISGDFTPGQIPHFIQWDTRWGFSYYNTELMAIAGCGPTSLSMVAVGLTGNTAFNPRHVADFAQANGHVTAGNDTIWTLMSEGSAAYGLSAREVMADINAVNAALNRGEPIIASVRAGDFTTAGHFIVLTCSNSDGTVNVLDSNSFDNSRPWPLADILPQMRNIWAFSLP